jgi:hypothetical protein
MDCTDSAAKDLKDIKKNRISRCSLCSFAASHHRLIAVVAADSPRAYCEQEVADFFTGQFAGVFAQQAFGFAQGFLVTGQVFAGAQFGGHFAGHCFALDAQPVIPRDATQAMDRRVRMDFIVTGR